MKRASAEGQRLLRLPENAWAAEAIAFYLDCKDHLRCGPSDLTPWARAAFRAIRQGSGGLLGNAPLL